MQGFSEGDGGQGWIVDSASFQRLGYGEPPVFSHGSLPRPEQLANLALRVSGGVG